jgi:hypothetical protein
VGAAKLACLIFCLQLSLGPLGRGCSWVWALRNNPQSAFVRFFAACNFGSRVFVFSAWPDFWIFDFRVFGLWLVFAGLGTLETLLVAGVCWLALGPPGQYFIFRAPVSHTRCAGELLTAHFVGYPPLGPMWVPQGVRASRICLCMTASCEDTC